jgi:CMP-N,N'-diacetyllegionaminic acid synthase
MIEGKRVLALVPARGGSKGIPDKNLLLLGGRPLLGWTAAAARASAHLDQVVLSTDSQRIADVGAQVGLDVPWLRPAALALDSTPAIDVVEHALDALPGFDVLVLLQPTSPLRTGTDIDAAVRRVVAGAPCCVSLTKPAHGPAWMFTLGPGDAMEQLIPELALPARRQELPAVYALNGAVYAADIPWLRRTRSFVAEGTVGYAMPAERSVDLDDDLDLALLEVLVARGTQ